MTHSSRDVWHEPALHELCAGHSRRTVPGVASGQASGTEGAGIIGNVRAAHNPGENRENFAFFLPLKTVHWRQFLRFCSQRLRQIAEFQTTFFSVYTCTSVWQLNLKKLISDNIVRKRLVR